MKAKKRLTAIKTKHGWLYRIEVDGRECWVAYHMKVARRSFAAEPGYRRPLAERTNR